VRATVEKIEHASSLMLTHSYSNSNLEMAGRMAQSEAGASAAGDSIESFPLVVRSPQLGPPPSVLHGDDTGVVRRRVSSPIPADRGSRCSSGDSAIAGYTGLVVPLLRLDESSVRSAPLAPSVSLSPRPPPPRIADPVGSQGTSSKSVDQRATFVRASAAFILLFVDSIQLQLHCLQFCTLTQMRRASTESCSFRSRPLYWLQCRYVAALILFIIATVIRRGSILVYFRLLSFGQMLLLGLPCASGLDLAFLLPYSILSMVLLAVRYARPGFIFYSNTPIFKQFSPTMVFSLLSSQFVDEFRALAAPCVLAARRPQVRMAVRLARIRALTVRRPLVEFGSIAHSHTGVAARRDSSISGIAAARSLVENQAKLTRGRHRV
jgi:hypothetical protein